MSDFSATQIKNASVQMFNDGVKETGTKFGCMGTLESETEVREKTKVCEGKTEIRVIPLYQTITVGAHIELEVLRNMYGLSNEDLKAGVYKYGINAKHKNFVFTADEIDEFGDVVKLKAYPNCTATSGMNVSIDNDADEVAYVEMEFRANPDEKGEIMYEAVVSEVDPTIAGGWHTDFTPTLIEEPAV